MEIQFFKLPKWPYTVDKNKQFISGKNALEIMDLRFKNKYPSIYESMSLGEYWNIIQPYCYYKPVDIYANLSGENCFVKHIV